MTNLEAAIWAREGRREGAQVRFLCPAHDDHHPSARWHPEKGAWYCHACHAGGGWRNLIKYLSLQGKDHRLRAREGNSNSLNKAWRFDWRRTAGKLEDHAQGRWLKAERVLGAAKGLDISAWSENDLDAAWGAIWRAFKDVDRSDFLEDLSCHIRCHGLLGEQHRHAPGR